MLKMKPKPKRNVVILVLIIFAILLFSLMRRTRIYQEALLEIKLPSSYSVSEFGFIRNECGKLYSLIFNKGFYYEIKIEVPASDSNFFYYNSSGLTHKEGQFYKYLDDLPNIEPKIMRKSYYFDEAWDLIIEELVFVGNKAEITLWFDCDRLKSK